MRKRRSVPQCLDESRIYKSIMGATTNTGSKYKTLKITYSKNKLSFFWSPIFFAFWIVLAFLVWWRLDNILPKPLTIDIESNHPNEFIAERAERRLQDLVRIGPRVVGSANNEQAAVRFLLDSIENIQSFASKNHYIEFDRQLASGYYQLRNRVNIYRNIQNVIVKLTSVNATSKSCLLINSHFDSVPGSPGAGDDGTMVAVMLEILRVLVQSDETLKHPIIFLFNGAEENPLQGSHAFITKHEWAKDVKAFINLDSAGNGGREILFQSGPAHSWLMKHYQEAIKHPFASTIGEEMFQNGLIPSDTDFRIFRDYGKIPGLDFAHAQNGYVYHTEYDKISSIPRGTLQNTGDNILSIAKALANSDELENPKEHAEGYTVFYDFLGFFLIHYTVTEALIINASIAIIAIITIVLSFCLMKKNSGLFCRRILTRFIVIFLIQIASFVIAFGLTLGVAYLLDAVDSSMSWYTQTWFIFGIYFCVIFFGLSILPLIYIKITEENEFFPLNYKIQMFLHSHCLLLVILLIFTIVMNINSGFLFMISVFCYTISLILNLITTLQGKSISWIIFPILLQILPFIFYTYMSLTILVIFVPMTGRSEGNPEVTISMISFIFAFLIGGFLIPLLFVFRKSEILVTLLGLASVIFIILAITPVGFPYKETTSFQRFSVSHTTRIFRDRNNQVVVNESGYYVHPMDRRLTHTIKDTVLNMSLAENINKHCDSQISCGLPFQYSTAAPGDVWIPSSPPFLLRTPILRTLNRRLVESYSDTKNRIRYEYSLTGPDHMNLIIRPLKEDCALVNWSFNLNTTDFHSNYFHILYSYGTTTTDTTLKFWLEFDKNIDNLGAACFDIAVTGHLNHHPIYRTDDFRTFLGSFPKWTYALGVMSSYESFKV